MAASVGMISWCFPLKNNVDFNSSSSFLILTVTVGWEINKYFPAKVKLLVS
ncbi:hypothetical protein LLCRE1631_01678 [Lactococcus lactis subsp. lactis CNCM I-1631]|nr:hypothetical protein LLCRE1631_01678 [Lactococcus lactis subsp. lactis CNCM I-1631]